MQEPLSLCLGSYLGTANTGGSCMLIAYSIECISVDQPEDAALSGRCPAKAFLPTLMATMRFQAS